MKGEINMDWIKRVIDIKNKEQRESVRKKTEYIRKTLRKPTVKRW